MRQNNTQNTDPRIWSSAPAAEASPEWSVNLLDYLQIILRYRKLVILVPLAATALAVVYALMQPNVYTARTKFLPPAQPSGGLSAALQGSLATAAGATDLLGASKASMLYVELLKLDSLRDQVIDRLKLQERYHTTSRQALYQLLGGMVAVQAGKEGIITLSVDDTDPKLAAEMANAHVEELKRLSIRMSTSGASNNKGFLEDQLARTREELTQAENALKAFQQKYKTVDVTQQVAVASGTLASLTTQLTAQELKLDSLRQTYADTSQEVMAARRALEALRGKIASLRGSGDSGVLPGFEKIPERGQEYLQLMRRFKSVEAVYESLTKQFETARINAENNVSSIVVVQKAVPPELKSGPKRAKMVLSALMMSLLAACGLAVGLDYWGRLPEGQRTHLRSLLQRRR